MDFFCKLFERLVTSFLQILFTQFPVSCKSSSLMKHHTNTFFGNVAPCYVTLHSPQHSDKRGPIIYQNGIVVSCQMHLLQSLSGFTVGTHCPANSNSHKAFCAFSFFSQLCHPIRRCYETVSFLQSCRVLSDVCRIRIPSFRILVSRAQFSIGRRLQLSR